MFLLFLFPESLLLLSFNDSIFDSFHPFDILDLNLLLFKSKKLLVESFSQFIFFLTVLADLFSNGVSFLIDLVKRFLNRLSVFLSLYLSLLNRIDLSSQYFEFAFHLPKSKTDLVFFLLFLKDDIFLSIHFNDIGAWLFNEVHSFDHFLLLFGIMTWNLMLSFNLPKDYPVMILLVLL